ncbi:helix-turn-helix transcriptional regulator [Micromonospora sp. DT178]|uniref:helix-turn-helix transcriptional regulator n=1 Tax=Micromonospora sp. DT178 TaxID=3393436 RepID=UPI003CEA68F3
MSAASPPRRRRRAGPPSGGRRVPLPDCLTKGTPRPFGPPASSLRGRYAAPWPTSTTTPASRSRSNRSPPRPACAPGLCNSRSAAHHDTTPMRYVRQIRLERAHRDLQAADPSTGVTVTMIARRWGFTHLGRFSTDYRAAYGSSPSHTLRT